MRQTLVVIAFAAAVLIGIASLPSGTPTQHVAPAVQASGLTEGEAMLMCQDLWMVDWLHSCTLMEPDSNTCVSRAFKLYQGCMSAAGFAPRSIPPSY